MKMLIKFDEKRIEENGYGLDTIYPLSKQENRIIDNFRIYDIE